MLPNKPSKLITLALNDLELVEKDARYRVRMSAWHFPDPYDNGVCVVCLAGAVMAKTLETPYDVIVDPFTMGRMGLRLYALDNFRRGYLHVGLILLGLSKEAPRFKNKVSVEAYEDSPILFKEDMRDMANQFKKAGL